MLIIHRNAQAFFSVFLHESFRQSGRLFAEDEEDILILREVGLAVDAVGELCDQIQLAVAQIVEECRQICMMDDVDIMPIIESGTFQLIIIG